jgi:hypothetical protein
MPRSAPCCGSKKTKKAAHYCHNHHRHHRHRRRTEGDHHHDAWIAPRSSDAFLTALQAQRAKQQQQRQEEDEEKDEAERKMDVDSLPELPGYAYDPIRKKYFKNDDHYAWSSLSSTDSSSLSSSIRKQRQKRQITHPMYLKDDCPANGLRWCRRPLVSSTCTSMICSLQRRETTLMAPNAYNAMFWSHLRRRVQ